MALRYDYSAVTRAENALKNELDQASTLFTMAKTVPNDNKKYELESFCHKLDVLIAKLEEKTRMLEEKYEGLETDEKEDQSEKFDKRLDDVNTIIAKAEDIILEISAFLRRLKQTEEIASPQPSRGNTPPPPAGSIYANATIQLPMTKLPTFKGDRWSFDNYWALFSELIDKPVQNKLIKFNHLLNSLEGEPRELLNRFQISDTNYEAAKKLLVEKYKNKRATIEQLHKMLKNLEGRSGRIEDQRKLYDNIMAILEQLKAQGQDNNNWMIQDMVISKFSSPIQRSVHRMKAMKAIAENNRDNDDTETTDQLMKQVDDALSTEEAVDSKMRRNEDSSTQVNAVQTQAVRRTTNQQPHQPQSYNQNSVQGKPDPRTCVFCKLTNHDAKDCRKFKTVEERIEAVKQLKLCFNCLKPHLKKFCQSKSRCRCCNGFHHTLLCQKKPDGQFQGQAGRGPNYARQNEAVGRQERFQNKPANQFEVRKHNLATVEDSTLTQGGEESTIQSFQGIYETIPQPTTVIRSKGYLPIIECQAFNESTREWKPISILLDTGADNTHIRQCVKQDFALPTTGKRNILLQTFGSQEPVPMVKETTTITLLAGKSTIQVNAMVADTLTGDIPRANLTNEDYQFIKENNIFLNSIDPSSTINPDIVVGTDVICKIWKGEMKQLPSGVHLINTIFGHTTLGKPEKIQQKEAADAYPIMVNTALTLDQVEDEQINWVDPANTKEFTGPEKEEKELVNDEVMKFFKDTIERREEGYVVKFPWKENKENLPSNYKIAFRRLHSVIKSSTPEVLQQVDQIFKDQLSKNIIEEVNKDAETGKIVHYNPHHPVITPTKTTTKCRVVVDGDCHYKSGLSLNDVINPGPVLLKDLFDLLVRFRSGTTAVISDIEKTFLYVHLHEEDRDATRILWLKDFSKPITSENLMIYRYTRVLFGVNVSPFLLNATIMHHLEQEENQKLAMAIQRQIYVDNILLTTDEEVNNLYKEMKAVFARANMNLREFRSNNQEFNTTIPAQDMMTEVATKVLGVLWKTIDDTMKITCKLEKRDKLTRRECSSMIASNFDPYGVMTPLFLKLKNFYSKLWRENQDWDTPILQTELEEWNQMVEEVNGFTTTMPRNLISQSTPNTLITFTDASKMASAGCVYVKSNGRTNLLAAKSKVTNKSQIWTIPKLELKALTEGARLTDDVIKACLEGEIKIDEVHILTDSEICKKWIERPPGKKDSGVYVTNRIRELKTIWQSWIEKGIRVKIGYVNTTLNPADAATRGLTSVELKNHIWWHGPDFITKPELDWPDNTKLYEIKDQEDVLINTSIVQMQAEIENPLRVDTNSFMKMRRIYARALKFIKKLTQGLKEERRAEMIQKIPELNQIDDEDNAILPHELTSAENLIIKYHQKTITTKSIHKLKELNPFYDAEGIARCRGRLSNIEDTQDTKHPIIIDTESHLCRLIIDEIHGKYHKAVGHTIADVREKYWIPRLRQQVKKRLRGCVRCQRFNNKPFRYPNMTDLPEQRVVKSRPFEHCGLDYFGPLKCRRRDGSEGKCYGAIITCSTTRLIYLDLARDLSTETFLLLLRRFFATHGIPSSIFSDNAPTFLLAKEILQDASTRSTFQDDVENLCQTKGIQWKNITAYSPWQGGFYERLIRSVKLAIMKAYGRRILTFEELKTSIQEVAGTLNCRPLTYCEENDTINPIRPIDFISPNILISKHEFDHLESDDEYRPSSDEHTLKTRTNTIEAMQSSLKLTERVWTIWQQEYLRELRNKHKIRMDTKRGESGKPKEGTIVLILDENQPRNNWRMAKIISIRNYSDGEIREVRLKTQNNREITRPINLLVPLEIEDYQEELPEKTDDCLIQVQPPVSTEEENADMEKRYNLRKRMPINYDEDIVCHTNSSRTTFETRSSKNKIPSSTQGLCPSSWLKILTIMTCFMTPILAVTRNSIECTNSGIRLHNYTNGEMRICADTYCIHQSTKSQWMPTNSGVLDVWLPASIKSKPHEVNIKAEYEGKLLMTEENCPPIDFCDSLSCTWCSENIVNPKCSPFTAIMVLICSTLAFFTISYCICCVPMRIGAPLIWTFKLIRWCCTRRRNSRLRRRTSEIRKALLAITILMMLQQTDGCQETEMASESNRVCTVRADGEETCSFETKESIKLNSFSREGCIRMNFNDTSRRQLKITLVKAYLLCQRETITFTRSIKQKVLSVKRCPHMGSCKDEKCNNVTTDSQIEELNEVNQQPGRTGCVETCGDWGCNCFFPSSACLFYRIYAEPTSNTTYEIFRCDTWRESVRVRVEIADLGNRKLHRYMEELLPSKPITLENITIKLSDLHIPPSSLLQSWFIQGNRTLAVWEPDHIPQLRCSNMDKADLFDCDLEDNCSCESAEITIRCKCKDYEIENHFNTIQHRFPVTTPGFKFTGREDVKAEIQEEISATFSITLRETAEIVLIRDEDVCKADNSVAHGCYKCLTGATTEIKCKSEKMDTIADLQCGDDHHSVQCSTSGTISTIVFFEQNAAIHKQCTISCGTVTHQMEISGILEFHSSYSTLISRVLAGDFKAMNEVEFPDFNYLLSFLGSYIQSIILGSLAVILTIGVIVVTIWFKCYSLPYNFMRFAWRRCCRRKVRRSRGTARNYEAGRIETKLRHLD